MPDASHAAPQAPLAVLDGSVMPWLWTTASALLLGGLGVTALRGSGLSITTLVVLALAALATAVLLLDLPRRSEITTAGIARVCLLRTELVPWDQVIAIERQRRRIRGKGTGGLIARGRRGRWLLSSAAEPPHVHQRLLDAVAAHAPSVRMVAEPPAASTDTR